MPEIDTQALENELKALISEIVEIEPEKITPEAKFVEDLGMDSMMSLEIVAAIEKKYKITIPEENLTKVTTLSSLLNMAKEILDKV